MADPMYTADEYASAMRALLPRGRVWTRESIGTQAAVIDGLALCAKRIDSDALTLITAAFPATALDMLPEWNLTLGIPDACFGAPQNEDQNRQQIVAKLIATGGQSIPYFMALAATLGITPTITEFSPHTVKRTVAVPINGPAFAHYWEVSYPGAELSKDYLVTGDVTEALATWSPDTYECLLKRYKPAHTILAFKST